MTFIPGGLTEARNLRTYSAFFIYYTNIWVSAMCGPLTMLKAEMVPWNLELRDPWVTKWMKGSFTEMSNTRKQVLAREDEYSYGYWIWDAYKIPRWKGSVGSCTKRSGMQREMKNTGMELEVSCPQVVIEELSDGKLPERVLRRDGKSEPMTGSLLSSLLFFCMPEKERSDR